MKFNLKDHPYLFLALLALVCLIASIAIAVIYSWKMESIVAVVISGVGFIILTGIFIYDLVCFNKGKKNE